MRLEVLRFIIIIYLLQVPEVLYEVFEEPSRVIDEKNPGSDIPQSLEEFMAEMRDSRPDARTFAVKLKTMVIGKS